MIPQKTILSRIKRLPTLSPTLARLASAIKDDRSSSHDIEQVIRVDPALSANVLRLANSSYFGCSREITSIRHAVGMLGRERIYRAAASAAFAGIVPKRLPGYDIDASEFWQHSIAVALVAERLAVELKIDCSELLFTAGLLHDIGKLVIGVFLSKQTDDVRELMFDSDSTFVAAEADVLGTDHSQVGYELARHWKLPGAICSAARWHHIPFAAPDHVVTVAVVHLADSLAHMMGYGADLGELARRADAGTLELVGGNVAVLERVASSTFAPIQELTELFVNQRANA